MNLEEIAQKLASGEITHILQDFDDSAIFTQEHRQTLKEYCMTAVKEIEQKKINHNIDGFGVDVFYQIANDVPLETIKEKLHADLYSYFEGYVNLLQKLEWHAMPGYHEFVQEMKKDGITFLTYTRGSSYNQAFKWGNADLPIVFKEFFATGQQILFEMGLHGLRFRPKEKAALALNYLKTQDIPYENVLVLEDMNKHIVPLQKAGVIAAQVAIERMTPNRVKGTAPIITDYHAFLEMYRTAKAL